MPKITEMFAFVIDDAGPGDEGVIGRLMPDGTWMPFTGADLARVESLMPLAQEIATKTGKQIRIYRFSQKQQIGTIEPKP